MNERMNKQDLLKLISTLNIDKSEFFVLSSGALVLRGIFPSAGDLDIAFTNKGLEQLKANFNLHQKENGWYIIASNIEGLCIGEMKDIKYQPEEVEGYFVQNILEYYNFITNSQREKDIARIPLVESYMDELGIQYK